MADGAALGDDRAMYRAAFVHWHTGKGSLLSPTPSTGQGCRLHHRSRSVFVSLGVAMTNVSVFLADRPRLNPTRSRCGVVRRQRHTPSWQAMPRGWPSLSSTGACGPATG